MNSQPQRLDVAFTIVWEAGWHVGSGQGTAAVDRLLRRRACGPRGQPAPYVPGSQIKGVLRHHCERLAALLGATVASPHVVGHEPPDEVLANFRPLAQSALLVDRLFGSRCQGDCLFVEDAVPEPDPDPKRPKMLASSQHSRTSIDRVSGTARDRTLFVTEVARKDGPPLPVKLQARHQPGMLTQYEGSFPFEYSLLLAGLLSMDALGGDKSTGQGRCRVTVDRECVRWNDVPNFTLTAAFQLFEDLGGDWFAWMEDLRGRKRA